MSSRKRKLSVDVMSLLDDVLLGEIIRLVGDKSYRYVAGTCRRFKRVYLEVFYSWMTSAKEMIQTVAGAELFCRETRGRRWTYWWLQDNTDLFFVQRRSPLTFVRDTAAKAGELEVLQWAVGQGCSLNDVDTFTYAAFNGNLLLLQCLQDNGCPWNSRACAAAAENGHLNAVQWLRAHGAPWDSDACFEAARNGHLTVLQWLRANGCRWGSVTCSAAAKNGHLSVLQWACANGCPWDVHAWTVAGRNGQWKILRWARANGFAEDSLYPLPED